MEKANKTNKKVKDATQEKKHVKSTGRRGKPKQSESSTNAWPLWFDVFLPFLLPTMACPLSFNINLQSVLCITAPWVLLLPLLPCCAPRWAQGWQLGEIPCDLELWSAVPAQGRLRFLVNFPLTWRGELASSQIHWIYWKSVLAECIYSPALLAVLLTGAERRFIETADIC